MKVKAKLTPARRSALEVLYRNDARESNQTTHADNNGNPCVYWQTLRWLIDSGFVVESIKPDFYRLTQAGIELAELIERVHGR